MAAFIFIDDRDSTNKIQFWNRRKKCWQDHLTRSCVYPTMTGAQRTLQKLFNSDVTKDFRPLRDWIGAHCLADFADHGFDKIRIRFG